MRQETVTSQGWLKWLGAAAIGAVTMYLSDPDRGKRRRTLARDKIVSAAKRAGDVLDVASRDVGNRLHGLRAEAGRRMFRRGSTVDDSILVERVRSRIGRAIAHPHPVRVIARQGRIALSGAILAHERAQLLNAVKAVPGVTGIDDNLEEHESAQGMTSLQGEGRLRQSRRAVLQRNLPPGLRVAVMLGGGALGLYGLSRRAPSGILFGALGLSLIARSLSNRPLAGGMTTAGTQAIELQKTIYIEAAPETVFDLWSNYENFPRFMSNVIDVQNRGGGRSHWVVSGPAGTRIEWDALLTDSVRPQMLAWKTEPGATVDQTGTVHFEPVDSGTRVNVHMSYSPPAGALGQTVASLFNGDPERQLEEDLRRMKDFIESGNAPRSTAQPLQPGQTLH